MFPSIKDFDWRRASESRGLPHYSRGVPYDEDVTPAARLVSGLLVIASFSSGLKAQSCSTFDVASIKPNTGAFGNGYPELAPGGRRFTATNQYVVAVLMFAYDVSPLQISGIPSAFSGERYGIEATCEQPMAKEQLPRMLQTLLAERFHLSVHRERKEQPVYALIPGKGGPKLHKASEEGRKPNLRQNGYSFTFTNAAMSELVGVLSQVTGRKVLGQKTGLRANTTPMLGCDSAFAKARAAKDRPCHQRLIAPLRQSLPLFGSSSV